MWTCLSEQLFKAKKNPVDRISYKIACLLTGQDLLESRMDNIVSTVKGPHHQYPIPGMMAQYINFICIFICVI